MKEGDAAAGAPAPSWPPGEWVNGTPDLVITAGRRLSCVALWIKQASGGRTRIVLIGKPRGGAPEFDLVVAAWIAFRPERESGS